MTKTILALLLLHLPAITCKSQTYIEPFIGYQKDLNSGRFQQFNTGIQYTKISSKSSEFFVQLQGALPFTTKVAFDSAFSPNPAVPVYTNAQKKVRPFGVGVSLGSRLKLFSIGTADVFSLMLSGGLKYEHIGVQYTYDKNNYTILNPDKTRNKIGLFVSAGIAYIHTFKTNRFFTQFGLSSVPFFGKRNKFPSSFGFTVPLSVNVGYSIAIKNRKHEK